MDYENETMLLSKYPDARCKVYLLGACIAKLPLSQWEIADPYGGTIEDIHKCFAIINNCVDGLAKILINKNYS